MLRTIRLLAPAALAPTMATACSSSTGPGTGTLAVQLSDAPFSVDSVKSVDVFVVRVDARRDVADSATAAAGATDDSASTGGWTTLVTPNASVDLLAYQNGAALPLGTKALSAGTYAGFCFVIDGSKSSVTLKTNQVLTGTSNPGVTFPSATRSGLKINLLSHRHRKASASPCLKAPTAWSTGGLLACGREVTWSS